MKRFNIVIASIVTLVSAMSTQLYAAEHVGEYPDGSWITVSGKVVEAKPDYFRMDYGEGIVLVEMDDWDWYDEEGQGILPGDNVIVQGRVDNALFEKRSIEASSVYVKGLNTYFYASSADEEGDVEIASRTNYAPFMEGSWLSFAGTVADIQGRDIILDTGIGEVRVDTSSMDYNPVDNVGFQQVEEGDQIVVNGQLDIGFYDNKEILAENLITMHGDA